MSEEMDNSPELRDLIPDYLADRMSAEQLAAFEKELAADPELAAETEEMARIRLGLAIGDRLQEGHVNSEDLVIFAEAPDELDDATRQEIGAHLQTCSDCAEEVKFCRPAIAATTEPSTDESKNLFAALVAFLFPPRLGIRPAFAYLGVLLVACVSYFAARQSDTPVAALQTFHMESGAERGETGHNLVVVDEATRIVQLEFNLPTIEGRFYELSLLDESAEPVFTLHHYRHRLPFSIEIPVVYLAAGPNLLRVREELPASTSVEAPETFFLEFDVRMVGKSN